MTTLVNILLIITVLIVPGSTLCNFPCEWIGKTFKLEDQLDKFNFISNSNLTFSKLNSSEAATKILGFDFSITCLKINGPYLWLKWSIRGIPGDFFNCLTVKILNPDVYTFVFREFVDEDGFCDACFEVNDKNADFGAARANGATDTTDVLTCKERPEICATYCKGLGQLNECRRHGYNHSRYQRPSYNYRKTRPYKKSY